MKLAAPPLRRLLPLAAIALGLATIPPLAAAPASPAPARVNPAFTKPIYLPEGRTLGEFVKLLGENNPEISLVVPANLGSIKLGEMRLAPGMPLAALGEVLLVASGGEVFGRLAADNTVTILRDSHRQGLDEAGNRIVPFVFSVGALGEGPEGVKRVEALSAFLVQAAKEYGETQGQTSGELTFRYFPEGRLLVVFGKARAMEMVKMFAAALAAEGQTIPPNPPATPAPPVSPRPLR